MTGERPRRAGNFPHPFRVRKRTDLPIGHTSNMPVSQLWALEQQRLAHPTNGEDAPPEGMIRHTFVFCPENAEQVLTKARSVLLLVNQNGREQWPSLEQWTNLLPGWFLAECRPEYTMAEAEAELRLYAYLSPAEQLEKALTESWALSNWLAYLAPEEREWFWWGSDVTEPSLLRVTVVVRGLPFPSGSLSWLLRAAGADHVLT